MSGVVIVGGGQAGIQVADSLRSGGFTAPVTVVTGETHLPYSRPPLSKQLLEEDADPTAFGLRPATFYADNEIRLLHGPAMRIDRVARTVHTPAGTVPYDRVVLATGARARRLEVPGADLPGVFGLRTLDDALALRGVLTAPRRVVVLGGGFVGLEVAGVARAHGAEVTVVERADRLLGRSVSARTAAFVAARHAATGVRLCLGEQVAAIVGEAGRPTAVRTASGRTIPADVVVVGVGAIPEDRLAHTAGLPTDRGVLVDPWLTTGDPRITAIGDCAAVRDPQTGVTTRLESVQNAVDQGRYVAARLLGEVTRPFRALPWFWSDQGALRLQMVIRTPTHDRTIALGPGGRTSVLRFAGGVLTGVESVDDPGMHQAARRLLAQTAPTESELSAVNFDLRVLARNIGRAQPAAAV